MNRFYVTFNRWSCDAIDGARFQDGIDDADAFDDEAVEHGCIIGPTQATSLRDAIQRGLEFSDFSQVGACEHRFSDYVVIRFWEWGNTAREETGVIETRDLHVIGRVTEASRARLLRLFTRDDPHHREACEYAREQLEGQKLGQLRKRNFQMQLIESQFALRALTDHISKHPDREAINRAVDEGMKRLLATRHQSFRSSSR